MSAEIVLRLKEKLSEKMESLLNYYGLSNRRFTNAILIKTISSFSCEKRIMYLIAKNRLVCENRKFDPIFRQKSAFATIKILDRVKTALCATGQEATILTEVSADSARYDAVVTAGRLSDFNPWDGGNVRIEIKASLGLDLEQVGRYLWFRSPLILVRVITGQVAKIYPSQVQSYASFSLEELSSKVDRLLSQKACAVPGIDCVDCPNTDCAWMKRKSKKANHLVTMSDVEFGEDLILFYQNLNCVAEKTAMMVVEELKGFSSARKYAAPISCKSPNQLEPLQPELKIQEGN
jgi:hypothetical protein